MDQSARESMTSSICLYAKAEEIEELIEDAYPSDNSENHNDLQSSDMSTQNEKLIDCS